MKKQFSLIGLVALLIVVISSCNVVKNQTATNNFKRVKYNSNIRLSKSNSVTAQKTKTARKFPETVESFGLEKKTTKQPEVYAQKEVKKETEKVENTAKPAVKLVKTEKVIKVLDKISKTKVESLQQKKATKVMAPRDNWWEDNIEDWPWLQIVLALVAILLIIMIVSLLFSVLGGLVSSLLGLILLLFLAYLIYTWWF